MFDLILFSTIALLLIVLIGFLVIVVRDHMKSKSFEMYIHHDPDSLQEQFDRSIRERTAMQEPEAPKRPSRAPRREEEPAPAPDTRPAEAPSPRRGRTVDPEAERKFREKLQRTLAQQHLSQISSEIRQSPADAFVPSAPESPSPAETDLSVEPSAATPELTGAQKQAREILEKDYGHFSHERLVEGMGLSPEEADEFVVELIHQLESAIPDLDKAVEDHHYEEVEHITHGLKGAALNIGEGGVAQLLVDYNTYMKHGTEQPVIEAYQTLLKRTVSDLKVEYSQVA